MKASKFNIFVERDNETRLLYNSMWGTSVIMDKGSFNIYRLIADSEGANHIKDRILYTESQTPIDQLKRGGFIVPKEIDELQYLRQRYKDKLLNISTFRLYVVPTNACNFTCTYCYYEEDEEHRNNKMSEEVQNSLLEFVEANIKKYKILDVIWTGGEPILAMDVITRLSKGFIRMAKKLGIVYNSSIFTNGYLLNGEAVEKLQECNVRVAQVTIDGPEQVHDSRRTLHSGHKTFKTIIENLKAISNKIDVAIRINLDSTNANEDHIVSLLKTLKLCNLPNTTIIELAQIMPFTTHCFEFATKHGLNSEKLGRKLAVLYPLIYENGFKPRVDIFSRPGISLCIADKCFGISEKGDIYKCFLLIGDKSECIGNTLVSKGSFKNNEKYKEWNKWDPFSREECKNCNILPICMGGGCPLYDVAENKYLQKNVPCIPLKFYLDEALELAYKMMQEQERGRNAI